MRSLVLTLTCGLILSGCITPEEFAQNQALEAEAHTVRIIPSELTSSCQYVDQVRATAGLSFFGGMDATENTAETRLKREALKVGGNAVRIADRLFDKGRGGSDQTRLTLYGDVYKCD